MGIRFLTDDPATRSIALTADDVVILPAFGVTVAMLEQLDRRGCTLVDTTCGSVLNVWKNVRRYAEGGYTVDHPRQGVARRNAGDRVAGGGVPAASYLVVLRSRGDRGRLRLHPPRRRPRGVPGALRQGARRPASIPIATCSASASPIRRRC